MKHESRIFPTSIDLIWLSLALFILVSIALLLLLTPQDYWWYLRLGQDVMRRGALPTVDGYSYTRAGVPFFYQSWLAGVVFWKVYEIGGLSLTFFLRALIILITYSLLWFLVRSAGAGTRLSALLIFITGLVGSSNWSFRPQLFAYPLFVLVLLILWKWNQGRPRGLLGLPVLSVLWVNLHGSFPLLFILGLLFLIFGRGDKKRLALVFGLAVIALLINPHGIGVAGYVVNMLRSPSNRYSIEWLPLINRGWQANLFYLWLLIFAPLAAITTHKLSRLDWTLFLVFGWMALSGERYVIWFAFILAFASAALLSEWDARFVERPAQKERAMINLAAVSILLAAPFALLPGVREAWWPAAPNPYDASNPIQATEWLAAHPELPGPLWSDFSDSSYLIFALPSRPVWIDTRFELYPPEMWDEYSVISNAFSGWQAILDRDAIQLVMLSTGGQPNLISAMQGAGQWCEQYSDASTIIFNRKGAGSCP